MGKQKKSGAGSFLSGARAVLGATLALAVVDVSATVLTFEGTAFGGSGTQFSDEYGDHVTNFGLVGDNFIYGASGGVTPNVVVDYLPAAPNGPFSNWTSGYGDLENALGHVSFGVPGEVVLTPDAEFQVTLHGFDIGAWFVDYPDSRVRVLDSAGIVRFDSGVFTALFKPNGVDVGHYSFPLNPITSSLALRIEVTDYGDLGLDNVYFSQSAVPLPAAAWLLGAAVGGLGFMRRRHAA